MSLLPALLVLLACAALLTAAPPSQTVPVPNSQFVVEWKAVPGCAGGGLVAVVGPSGVPVLESLCGRPVVSVASSVLLGPPVSSQGGYTLEEVILARSAAVSVDSVAANSSAVVVAGTVNASSPFTLLIAPGATTNQVAVSASVTQPGEGAAWNRVFLTLATTPDEAFVGLGTQYTQWNLKGLQACHSARTRTLSRSLSLRVRMTVFVHVSRTDSCLSW